MHILLNNTPEEILAETLTINELLRYKNFTFRLLVIKVNGKLVRREDYDTTIVHDGDHVVVMHLVSGG
ncbi:MAG: sulfur carrier protein ThiS [Bacteroidales bacterium]|nr:sulfur carrier protein ThiS [Lentimicrobiaceae bacterium]MDD5695720.1 sulfur carrier protein ThiS [Bacteroidales bacterium]